MRSIALSMRWWLALAFAGIAALTGVAVSQVFITRSEAAIHVRAEELVAGAAVTAAARIKPARSDEEIRKAAATFGKERGLSLFAFDDRGSLLTPARVGGISVARVHGFAQLLAEARAGRRKVETIEGGRLVAVALPVREGRAHALIAVASRSDLGDALGIVRRQIVLAALWATGLGALVGLIVSLLITRRLRRIAAAAAEIEQGRFDRKLEPRFGDELGALAATIDRMRARLRDSFDRLEGERDRSHRLLEQLLEGVVAVDRDLTVVFANSRARRLLRGDLAPGVALPDPWPSFSLHDAVRAAFTADAAVVSSRVEPEAGTVYTATVLPPAASSEAVLVLTDVTAEERRGRAEREFVTNAAHELRTPIAAIASAVEALQRGAKLEPSDRDRFLAVVERQTSRLTNLAHALLTLARAQTRSEPVKLEAVAVEPVVREIARSAGSQVAVEIRCEEVVARAHAELLRHALDNLVANAIKHSQGGALSIRAMPADPRRVRIDVVDDGPGMTQTQADRALDRFYRSPTATGEGFGLGLSIVREVVGVMEGSLAIASRPGAGTTVSITLDAAEPVSKT